MAQGDPLFIFRLCPVVLSLLELAPRDGRELLVRCGLPENAALGAVTAPLSRFRRLFDEASLRKSGAFGLALARAAPEGTYETAELLVRTAPTIGRGLEALARFAPLINPVGRFSLREAAGALEVHYFVAGSRDALGAHLNEFTIAFMLRALRRISPTPLVCTRAWMAHADVGHRAELEAELGGPLRFGRSTCGFAIPAEAAAGALRTSDPVVFDYLERQAEARLALLGQRSYAAVVVEAIESQTGFASATLQSVAKALAVTERTIQRRLEDEGTSFRDVLDGARARHAESMLASGIPAPRIAEALGFSDVRSFRRAFHRWGR